MNNKENNKLIAKFMNREWDYEDENDLWIRESSMLYWDAPDTLIDYHNSWDWLMDVVDEIWKKGFTASVSHFSTSFTDDNDDWGGIYIQAQDDTDSINACYKAIVKFIKWYNEENNENLS